MATTTARAGTAESTGRPAPDTAAQSPPAKPKSRRSKRKILLLVLPVFLVLAVAAKMLLLGGGGNVNAAPKPGPIITLDPVTVNLAAGHYLRIGIAVQFTAKVSAAQPPNGAPAIDQTIAYFTGRDAGPLQTAAGLAEAKKGLKQRITAVYPDDPVYDVLVTSFVVQ